MSEAGKVEGGLTVREIAREYLPTASDDEIDFVIWTYTGWPAFWTGDPETCFRRQLSEFAADPEGVAARQDQEYAALLTAHTQQAKP